MIIGLNLFLQKMPILNCALVWALCRFLPKKSIDQAFTTPSLTPLMGSGAYQLGKVVAGRSVSYVRNLNYWGVGADGQSRAI